MDLDKIGELSNNEFLKHMAETWAKQQIKEEQLYSSLFKVSSHYSPSELFYIKYFEPVTFFVSLTLIIIVFIVFKRGNALKPVQILLLITCSLDVLAFLLLFPLDTIFAYFVEVDAPVPAPICSIFIYISLYVMGCLLSISQAAKLILSINRVICIRFPIKAKLWLTNRKMIKICVITFIVVLCVYVPLNWNAISIDYVAWYGKFWNTEHIYSYKACSLTVMSSQYDAYAHFALSISYTVILRILPLLVLFVSIVLLLVFLRKKSATQKALNSSNKKLFRLSRITTVMLINFAILEIPQVVATCMYLYMATAFIKPTNESLPLSRDLIAVMRTIYKVTFGASSSISMLVYAVMSQKFRKDFLSLIRCRQIETKRVTPSLYRKEQNIANCKL